MRARLQRALAQGRVKLNGEVGVWCGKDPRPSTGSALQRLYAAATQEVAEVGEEALRGTLAEAARGWLMAARLAMWRVRAADVAARKGVVRPCSPAAAVRQHSVT